MPSSRPAFACRAIVCALLAWTAANAFGQAIGVVTGREAERACSGALADPPAARADGSLLPDSRAAQGSRDIGRAWIGSPTRRYGHAALGSDLHGASLHARRADSGQEVVLQLPADSVIEDRLPRLVDLDGDGRDELVVVHAHRERGAELVVHALAADGARWTERARGPAMGAMRWLNPVGMADFDADGTQELVAVATPHIGGVLQLLRYAPPRLDVVASLPGVSNHRMGSREQRLSAILRAPGRAPRVVVPDRSFRQLRLLGWRAEDGWHDARAPVPLAGRLERVVEAGEGVCVLLDQDAQGDRAMLLHAR